MELLIGQSLALITAFCFAQNSLIYSHVGKIVSSSTTAHIRLWIAFPLMLVLHLLFLGTLFPVGMNMKQFLLIALSGVLGFCIADLFIFSSLVKIGARQTSVVMTTSPLFSTLFAWIADKEEVISLQQGIGIAVTLIGVAWVVLSDKRSAQEKIGRLIPAGVILALLGASTQALAMVLANEGMEGQTHPISANVIRLGFGLAALIIYSTARRSFISDFRKFTSKEGKRSLFLIFLAALVGPVLGIILYLQAMQMAPVGIVTTLSQMSPVILLPIDKYILKKYVSPFAIIGTFVAVFGTVLLFIAPA